MVAGPTRARPSRRPCPTRAAALRRAKEDMISAAMTARAFLHPAVLCSWAIGSSVRLRQAVKGHRRTGGDAAQILAAGLEECWRGDHLNASPGYYRQFWTRDTGFTAPAPAPPGPPPPQ